MHQSVKANPGAARKLRAVIADDQQISREVLRRLLKSEPDIEVVGTSANGREALDEINRLEPDLVFLDVQMPELDGFGVADQIRCRPKPAIIFVTAGEDYASQAKAVQAAGFILKPCTKARFQETLQEVRGLIGRSRVG